MKETTGDHRFLMRSWQEDRNDAIAYPEDYSDADLAWLGINRTTDHRPQERDDFLQVQTEPIDTLASPKTVRLDEINPLITGNKPKEERK